MVLRIFLNDFFTFVNAGPKLVVSRVPSVNMADNLANAARMQSRDAERLTTQVMTTVESIPSSSTMQPTASGSSRVERN